MEQSKVHWWEKLTGIRLDMRKEPMKVTDLAQRMVDLRGHPLEQH